MTDSGASATVGIRRHERHRRRAAPARCPAYGPTLLSSRRCSRSRHTMNAQRCWFLELLARRPACRMRSRWSGSSGRSANWRTTRRDWTTRQTGSCSLISRDPARRRRAGRGRVGAGRPPGAGRGAAAAARPARVACVAPGRATWASVRKPPGVSATAAKRDSPSGIRSAGAAAAAARRLVGRQRATEGGRQEPRDGRPVGRVLVQPRVLAAGEDEGLDRRRRRRCASRRAASARRRRWLDRHDLVGIAVGQQHRPAVAGDGPRGADVGRRCGRAAQVDAGRQPGQGVRDRVRDRQVGEVERLAREPVRIGRAGRRDDRGDPRVRGGREERPDRPHRVAGDGPDRHLVTGEQRLEGGQRVRPRTRRR